MDDFTGIEICHIGPEIRAYDVHVNGFPNRGGASADGYVIDPCPACENVRKRRQNRDPGLPRPCGVPGMACRIERTRLACSPGLANVLADGLVMVLELQDENG